MRPVNLIPPEQRRGDRAPLRAGALSYVVVGAIATVLAAVVALVLTQNGITERENEIAELEVARDAAAERAAALAPYAEFASLQARREATIASLAKSRFDWERVLRELALVIPGDISLDSLEAAAAGEDQGATATAGGAPPVPSLVMSGCGPNHGAVAAFVAALEDIDGVTRVGLESSAEGEEATSTGSEAGSDSQCDPSAASFALTAVFDGVEVAAAEPVAPAAPAPAEAETETASSETNSQEEQVDQAGEGADLITGAVK